jgi:hypothetical protein
MMFSDGASCSTASKYCRDLQTGVTSNILAIAIILSGTASFIFLLLSYFCIPIISSLVQHGAGKFLRIAGLAARYLTKYVAEHYPVTEKRSFFVLYHAITNLECTLPLWKRASTRSKRARKREPMAHSRTTKEWPSGSCSEQTRVARPGAHCMSHLPSHPLFHCADVVNPAKCPKRSIPVSPC